MVSQGKLVNFTRLNELKKSTAERKKVGEVASRVGEGQTYDCDYSVGMGYVSYGCFQK